MLLKGVLWPRLLSNPFASCFLINLDFLVLKSDSHPPKKFVLFA